MPKNVRVVKADGTVIMCELAYGGIDDDGYEVWNVATELQAGDRVAISAMGGNTKLCAPVAPEVITARVERGTL